MNKRNKQNIKRWRASAYGVALLLLIAAGCDGLSDANEEAEIDNEQPDIVASWQTLDFPWSSVGFSHSGDVLALMVHDGDLIVGGWFGAGNYIARWDGSTWHQMGTGMNGPVKAFGIFEGHLIAGGVFTMAGGQSANSIARWDGSAWKPLGEGITGSVMGGDPVVEALTVHEGNLIAAGTFATAGGQTANSIARWDGSEWQSMGTKEMGRALALIVHEDVLIVGGEGTVSQWDGSEWQEMVSGIINTFTIHKGDLYAGGYINSAAVYRLDDSTWQSVGTGTKEYANAFAVHEDALITGGDFPDTFGAGTNHIARWDGTTWQPMGEGMDSSISALTVYKGDLIAGGSFRSAGGNTSASFVARWGMP